MQNMMTGRTLGKYRITEHLGSGGMSEVYKAYQPGLDRYVAIKVLHSFLAEEEDFLTRFQREAKVAAMLRHPNIIQVYDFDFDVEDRSYYMVMELIDGPTLKSRLQELARKGEAMPLEEAVEVVIALANALDYAHQRGMVHRDVKPANIMFTDDDQAVLTDFGIAKMVDVAGLTASGAMVGTPAYMAPEQGMGQAGDERADIYSLGVVLYQLVTGRLPFDADTPLGVALRHINAPPPMPTSLNADVPPAVEAVIMRAMAKDPNNRYRTAKDFATELKLAMSGQYVEPPPVEHVTTPPPDFSRVQGAPDQWDMATLPNAPAVGAQQKPSFQIDRRVAAILLAVAALLIVAFCAVISTTGVGERLIAFFNTEEATAISTGPTEAPDLTATYESNQAQFQIWIATYIATTGVTPTPSPQPTSTPDQTATALANCDFDLEVTDESTVFPRVLTPGQQFTKQWTVENTGTCAWPASSQMVFVSGQDVDVSQLPVIPTLEPGESTEIEIVVEAPQTYDSYSSVWQLQYNDGTPIGEQLVVEYTVGPTPTPRPTSTPTSTPTPEVSPTPSPALWMSVPGLAWCTDIQDGGRVEWGYGGGPSDEYRFFYSSVSEEFELDGPYYTFGGFPHVLTYYTTSGELPETVSGDCCPGDVGRYVSPDGSYEIVWQKVYVPVDNCP